MRKRLLVLCVLLAGVCASACGGAAALGYTERKNVEISQMPTARTIVYGEDLYSAVLRGGQAVDPDTRQPVSGSFEWDRPDYVPGVGDQECLCWFIPSGNDADLYREKIFNVTVCVDRVKLECVELPVSLREYVYGEPLRNVPILGGTVVDPQGNEIYGAWTYESGERRIEAGGEMVKVRFEAEDFLHYKTVTTEIKVTCRPFEPRLTVRCEPLLAGSALKEAVLRGTAQGFSGEEVPGTFAFEKDHTVLERDGTYTVIFTPEDTKNYASAACETQVIAAAEPVRADVSGVLIEGHPLEEARLSVQARDSEGNPVAGEVFFTEDRNWFLCGENRVAACFVPEDSRYGAVKLTVSLFVQYQVNVWAEIFVTPGQTVREGLLSLTAVNNVGEEVPGFLVVLQEQEDLTWEETGGSVVAVFIPEDGQTYDTPHVEVKVVLLEDAPAADGGERAESAESAESVENADPSAAEGTDQP